jgi:aspartyl/asparaginyl beta-hydroxylase (cupin superfamily)
MPSPDLADPSPQWQARRMNAPAPNPAAAAANQRGMAALQAGDGSAAAAHFRDAIAADPRSGALQRNLASAYRAAQDDAGELAALAAAIALDQRDLMAWLRKAELHERRGEDGSALAAWNAAVQLSASLNPLPPALVPLLTHGRDFIANATGTIAAAVDDALSPLLAGADGTSARRGAAFAAHALKSRPVYQNQCAGLFYPFLPADEFFDDIHFPWFAAFEAQTGAIRTELEALLADPGDALRPYVRMGEGAPDSIWSGLDNRLDWGACFLWEYGAANQAVLDRCPVTTAALAAIPGSRIAGRSPSAFFSLLRPHTRIPPHTGVTNTRAIVHLPLIVPPGCGFRVGGETRAWVEGRAFAFDDTIEHEAWNDSDELRAVLICDVWNPHLSMAEQDMITAYYAAADATGFSDLGAG